MCLSSLIGTECKRNHLWAIPKNFPFPEPGECPNMKDTRQIDIPKPSGALDNIMEVIKGNESLWFYFLISLFCSRDF